MQFKYILLMLLYATLLNATIYEDGNNGINAWNVYDNTPEGATISNVFDEERASDVIKLEGSGTQNGYMIGNWCGTAAWNATNSILSWSMKYAENYNIFISLQTVKGHRYVYYTNAESHAGFQKGRYIHHGLGKKSANGKWHTITRNLELDLKDYEKDNSIMFIDAFLVRGSGLLDDIKLTSANNSISTAYYTVEEVKTVVGEETSIYRHNIDDTDTLVTLFSNEHMIRFKDGINLKNFTSTTINNITYFLIRFSTVVYSYGTQEHVALWKTDGTVSGTTKIKTFGSNNVGLAVEGHFIDYGNEKLHFLIKTKNRKIPKTQYDFWQSDGSNVGTLRMKSIVKEK